MKTQVNQLRNMVTMTLMLPILFAILMLMGQLAITLIPVRNIYVTPATELKKVTLNLLNRDADFELKTKESQEYYEKIIKDREEPLKLSKEESLELFSKDEGVSKTNIKWELISLRLLQWVGFMFKAMKYMLIPIFILAMASIFTK